MKDSIKIIGHISVVHKDKDGIVKATREVDNTIANASFAALSGLAGGVGSENAFDYIALGTGTTGSTANDTSLESEIGDTGLDRAQVTPTQETTTETDDTTQLVKEWTATGSKAVTECGVLNAASSGILFGRQVFSALNVISGDKIKITYKFKFS